MDFLAQIKIKEKHLQWLCLCGAILGIFLLYFWPEKSGYSEVSIAQALILPDSKLISLHGQAQEVKISQSSLKFKLCGSDNSCISVLPDSRKMDLEKLNSLKIHEGCQLVVYGEISSVYGNKFVRVSIIEREQEIS